ncbi:hypothetical protein IAU60_006052 [Kwoniella sp. DSM 27419]
MSRGKGRASASTEQGPGSDPQTEQGEGYCHSCGRLLPSDTRTDPTPRKYCSNTCRGHAKSPSLRSIRHDLIVAFHQSLSRRPNHATVLCSEVERGVFGADPGEGEAESPTPPQTRTRLAPAEQREEARRAARRIVAFGFRSQGIDEDRPVQAAQGGKPVPETSFAKGEWGLRWA